MKLTANPAWLSVWPHGNKGSGAKFLRIMKLTSILILAACLHTSAKGVAQQTITFSGKEVSLEYVFNAIKKQTNYRFFFNTDMLTNASKITIDVKNAQVEQVMKIALQDQPLTFMIKGRTIFIMKKPEEEKKSVQVERTGDPITVSGRVTDDQGQPLAGANVKVKGGSNGVTTDAQGRFTLNGVDPNASLEVSFVGHETQLLAVKGKTVFSVALGQRVAELDETVVIAYGTTTKRFNTGNVSSVKANDIEKQPVNNPILALQGRVPGLFITQSKGIPGGAVSVRIQGQNSLTKGNEPLYVVDGVPFPSENLSTTSQGSLLGNVGQGGGSPLAFINPSDIESITVLKDADATAIYGSRAANGAILIVTKKGRNGESKIDININHGWGKVARMVEMMDNNEYLQMRKEGLAVSNSVADATRDFDILNLNGWDTSRNTNWLETLCGGTAEYTNLSGNVSGGSSAVQYFMGAGYRRETSVFPGNFSNQTGSAHFSIASKSKNQRFQSQLSGTYLVSDNKLPELDLATLAVSLVPTAPTLYNDDGSLNWGVNDAGTNTWSNPVSRIFTVYNNKTTNLISNAVLNYQILRGLDVKCSFGYNNLRTNTLSGYPLTVFPPHSLSTAQRVALYSFNTISSWIIEPQVNYQKNTGLGKLNLLLGSTIQQTNNDGQSLRGAGYNSDAVLKDIRSAATISSNSSVIAKYKYNAVFARINFNVLDKYIFNLTARRDGSSRFGSENLFQNFGAASLAWIFSEERLIKKNFQFISFGKLRASYGITGNDQIGDYTFLSLYSPVSAGNIPYQNVTGLQPNILSNPSIQWEETKKLNVGLDVNLFNEKILISANYVYNRSSNQLLNYVLPIMTGWSSVTQNFPATVQNTALELTLGYKNRDNREVGWSSNINFTLPRNKLVSFTSLETSSYANTYVIGQPVDVKRRYHYIDVDPITGLYTFADLDGNTTSSPSSTTDRIVLISNLPKYYGGWENSIRFKNFKLDVLFQFVKQIASTSYKYGNPISSYVGVARINQPKSVLQNYWQKTGDIANVQKYGPASQATFATLLSSDAVNVDASYIRLKNLFFSYSIPSKWCSKVKMDNCSIFLQGQNLLTVTNFEGSDPESAGVGVTGPLKVITFGVKLGF